MAAKKQVNPIFLTDDDQYLFGKGRHYEIYKKLGAHESCEDGTDGFYFAVLKRV